MYVLGIETSCDETAAAVVRNGTRILSSVVASSLKFHRKFGGIVPEIASRKQLEVIAQVTQESLDEAKIRLSQVGLIGVTSQPGLAGSLLVGISFAKSLSLAADIPLLGINHLHSHVYAGFMGNRNIRFPFIAMIVSGGHTSLYEVFDFDTIKLLGATHDDACGEAFDKVAKILGLGYPGGPAIERIARKGNSNKIKFRCSDTDSPLDFSFSGIKTAVLYYTRKKSPKAGLINDIAASFQEAVIETLIRKSFLACKSRRSGQLVIGGGVAANEKLRAEFYRRAKEEGISVYFPSKELCMDNAAMVAGLGYRLFLKKHLSDLTLSAGHNG